MANWSFLQKPLLTNVVRAEDEYLYLNDGTQVFDAAGGAIVTNIGHGRDEVVDTLAKASKNVDYVIPPWVSPERQRLIDRLVDNWLDPSLNHVHFTCGGSEGIECAIKIAFMHHAAQGKLEKTKVIKREISYHGTTITATAVGGHELRKRGIEHILDHYPRVETPYPFRCPSKDVLGYYIEDFERVVNEEGPETIAAFITEPISGASGGAIVPPDGYLEAIDEICKKNDILLIVDEVMTGFGRTGTKFGYQHWDVQPDLIVGGKGLAGGYGAITAVAGTDELADSLNNSGFEVMFHTFASLPSACAAADKVLEIIERENLLDRVVKMGNMLEDKLSNAFSNHPHVGDIRGRGLLQAVELVKDRDTLESYAEEDAVSTRVVGEMLRNGVFVYKAGNGIVNDVLLIGPPFTVQEHQLDRLVSVMSDAIDTVTMNGKMA